MLHYEHTRVQIEKSESTCKVIVTFATGTIGNEVMQKEGKISYSKYFKIK